jgi:hypothetical protein
MACVGAPTSTLKAGPAAVAGVDNAAVVLPDFVVSPTLVAVTVTVAGAGYGVVYNPAVVIVPGLNELSAGAVTDHVTALL